jgi:hypothetical protein
MAKLLVDLPDDLKHKLEIRAAVERTHMSTIVANLVADHLGVERPKPKKKGKEKRHNTLPPKENFSDWVFEINGVSVEGLTEWLAAHPHDDTSIKEVWAKFFKLPGKASPRQTIQIGNYIRRAGWGRTKNPRSSYRVKKEFGPSRVYLRATLIPFEDELVSEEEQLLV